MTVFSFAEPIARRVPLLLADVVAIAAGLGVLALVGRIASRLWGIASPDPIEMLYDDVTSVTGGDARDFRVQLPRGAPLTHRAANELLYSGKWMGTLLVFLGLGRALYHVMLSLGVVGP